MQILILMKELVETVTEKQVMIIQVQKLKVVIQVSKLALLVVNVQEMQSYLNTISQIRKKMI